MSNYSLTHLMPKMGNNVGKAGLAAGYAYAIDKYYLGETDNNRSLMFGAVVFGGMLFEESFGMLLKPVLPLPNVLPKNSVISGKKLVDRIAETLATTGVVFLTNKYLFRNDIYKGEILKRMAVIAAADISAVTTLHLLKTTSSIV